MVVLLSLHRCLRKKSKTQKLSVEGIRSFPWACNNIWQSGIIISNNCCLASMKAGEVGDDAMASRIKPEEKDWAWKFETQAHRIRGVRRGCYGFPDQTSWEGLNLKIRNSSSLKKRCAVFVTCFVLSADSLLSQAKIIEFIVYEISSVMRSHYESKFWREEDLQALGRRNEIVSILFSNVSYLLVVFRVPN